jgi:hypothetical protein
MSPQKQDSMVDCSQLKEGMSVGSVYTLGHRIRHADECEYFTAAARDGEKLLMRLDPDGTATAEEKLDSWRRSRLLRHPNLLELRDAGRSELAGSRYIYAVFEHPDDFLATALESGPLSEMETRGVLEAALSALAYLHGEGWAHGAVSPDRIVAVGDNVKFLTDSLIQSASLEAHVKDVRQLGTLLRALRAPERLTEPLATIAQHATAEHSTAWTLADVARALEPGPAIAPATRLSSVGEQAAEPRASFPKWIIYGVAILLLSVVLFNIRRKPVAQQVSAPLPVHTPPAQTIVAPAPARAPVPAIEASRPGEVWRVIAYTYRSREMAARKAAQIDKRWPDLEAAVFAPQKLRGYFLVSLGKRMTREDAVRLQRKAQRAGLPRDTFVQNYGE